MSRDAIGAARWSIVLLAGFAAGGCRKKADPGPPDTGAKSAARAFYDALLRRDDAAARAVVDPEPTADAFGPLAEGYRAKLGFGPTAVHVLACEEHGDDATAHVELTGPAAGRHRYKDAITHRSVAGGWRVVLPPTFGTR